DSIANNIAFGVSNAKMEDIQKYARLAEVHEDIMRLLNGYETMVGERGVTLSGGQKQRIAIARAFIKNPGLVILDDTLSAVDSHTEEKITRVVVEEIKGQAGVLITHRAYRMLEHDKMIVFENGKLAQEGKHDELIREG